MTPTPPSTAAGSDPRPALLASWLRRAARHPRAETLILRGSLLLGAWCPAGARPPADVDYLVLGAYDEPGTAAIAAAVAATPDEGGPHLAIEGTEPIWAETAFPGVRAHVVGRLGDGAATAFHVDFAFGDPLSAPPRATPIDGVGPVLGCTPETLFAWKLHGMVEFGRGRWRAKDLYDLDLLWRAVPMSLAALRPAVDLAFASRDLPLSALDELRTLDAWGRSRSSARKWRGLARKLPAGAAADFFEVRARLRGAIDAILGAAAPVTAAGP